MIAAASNLRTTRRRAIGLLAGCGAVFLRTSCATAAEFDVETALAGMTPRQQAARKFMIPIAGTSLTADEDSLLRGLRPGGVILVGNNFGTPGEVQDLVWAIHDTNPELPPLVALDQEGGIVSRIADDPAPDAPSLGAMSLSEIATLARVRAEALAAYGFDANFAPVADVSFSPDSAMNGRTFGGDAQLVAAAVGAYVEGVAGTGVLHCVKHFPGHGRVAVDSHESLPVLEIAPATWRAADALPFAAAIDAGVPMVMLGHLVVPAWDGLPASLSAEAVRVLREDLGFAGVVVSDDLGMGALAAWEPLQAIDLAVNAGVDLLLYVILPDDAATLVDHLASRAARGEIASDRVTASVRRLLQMQFGPGGPWSTVQ